MINLRKNSKKITIDETLGAVHTHTHTCSFKSEKIENANIAFSCYIKKDEKFC